MDKYIYIAENANVELPLKREILKNPQAILKQWVENGADLRIIGSDSR